MSFLPILTVGALYPNSGLLADALASRAVDCIPLPVCTAIAMASHDVVTDITDVPTDTVQAQLEHLASTSTPEGVKLGVLAGHATAEAVFSFCRTFDGPTVLDVQLSGSCGETVLTPRGIEVLRQHLDVPDLVLVGRTDAELLSGGAIESLDDAQVAAQRIVRQGKVRALVIKCGPLPARFFEVEGAERPDDTFDSDLYYDGSEFSLFEAPHLKDVRTEGASSAFTVPMLRALIEGHSPHEAVQEGKRFVTEALRYTQELGAEAPLQYFWRASAPLA